MEMKEKKIIYSLDNFLKQQICVIEYFQFNQLFRIYYQSFSSVLFCFFVGFIKRFGNNKFCEATFFKFFIILKQRTALTKEQ